MAIIKPFRGFRFNPAIVHNCADSTAPLWEVLNQTEKERLKTNPNNIIHVSQPSSLANALKHLVHWRKTVVLLQDEVPSIYPYYQRFSIFGSHKLFERKGFIAVVKINENQAHNKIIVHENTIKEGTEDRLAFLRQGRFNITPTHGLYYDPNFEIEQILDRLIQPNLLEFTDVQGVLNRLAKVSDTDVINTIIQHLANKPIYLADGHHRLETSIMICQEEQKNINSSYLMMYLTNYAAPDLKILPTHRLIKLPSEFDFETFWKKIGEYFYIYETDKRSPLPEEIKKKQHAIGLVFKSQAKIIQLKESVNLEQDIKLDLPISVKKLDYTLLHYLVLDKAMNIPYEKQPTTNAIRYSKDYSTLIQEVYESSELMAAIVNEVSIDNMLQVCNDGAIMPQKSTYFFPKVVSGTVLFSVDDEDA